MIRYRFHDPQLPWTVDAFLDTDDPYEKVDLQVTGDMPYFVETIYGRIERARMPRGGQVGSKLAPWLLSSVLSHGFDPYRPELIEGQAILDRFDADERERWAAEDASGGDPDLPPGAVY